MDITELEKKHKSGVLLIKQYGYYERIISEVQYLIKYIDNKFFHKIFTENLFNDMKGVFCSFIRQDLKSVYEELVENPNVPLDLFFNREYLQLTILRKCTTNIRYQVKSLARMPDVKSLEFKSSFLRAVTRKLNGEIQNYYRLLVENYKQYFRYQFTTQHKIEDYISLDCINHLNSQFDTHFITIMNPFYQLSDAINFVQNLFKLELENEIRNRIASIYFEKQDDIENVVDFFINDLKKNFIKTIDRNIRNGHDYKWILKGLEQFIASNRFQKLLQRVLLKSMLTGKRSVYKKQSIDIF